MLDLKRAGPARVGRPSPRDLALFVELPLFVIGFVIWHTVRDGWGRGWLGDFRIFRTAAHTLVHGHSPYVAPTAHLLAGDNRFVYPAPFALPFAPFNLLGPTASSLLYLALSVAAVVLAVRLFGITDWRVAGVAILGGGVYNSFVVGSIGPFLLLALAAAWRKRESPVSGVLLAGAAAAKLFLWPVLLWPLIAGRRRVVAAEIATLAAILGLWALMDLHGLAQYVTTLRVLDRLESPQSYSLEALAVTLGVSTWAAHVLPLCAAAVGVVWLSRLRNDRHLLSATVIVAIAASPILWLHYLALLVVPLALAQPQLSLVWALPVLLWASDTPESSGVLWKIVFVLAVAGATAAIALRRFQNAVDESHGPNAVRMEAASLGS